MVINAPGIVGHRLVYELHLDLVEDVLEVVLAGGQLELVVPVVGALEHDDVAVHQFVQYLAACTRLNPSGTPHRGSAAGGAPAGGRPRGVSPRGVHTHTHTT